MTMTTPTVSEGVVIDAENQKAPLTASKATLDQLLTCIECNIVPLTRAGVAEGNKVFGAAILKVKTDDSSASTTLEPVICGTNGELQCPLFHGEVHTIFQWCQAIPPGQRGTEAASSIFLSTHEPCCLCISAICWAGFTQTYYLFPYEATAAQGIPHDLNIMHELWGVTTYRKENKFMATACLMKLVQQLPEEEDDDGEDGGITKASLQARIDALVEEYDTLSAQYHTEKANNTENSLAFG